MKDNETTTPRTTAADVLLSDPRTGLTIPGLQRAQLGHALARASRFGTKVGLLFIDLDDINERLEREVLDQVHVLVAARLRACLRGIDLTAQLDEGGEFVIVCEALSDACDVDVVAARVTEALAAPLHVGETLIELRATVGTATSAGADEPGALLVAANDAMTRNKTSRSA